MTPGVDRAPTNELPVAGIMVGSVAVLVSLIPFFGFWISWFPGSIALIFGLIGVFRARKHGVRMVASIASITLAVVSVAITAGWFAVAGLVLLFAEH